jgi:hypothetical protein
MFNEMQYTIEDIPSDLASSDDEQDGDDEEDDVAITELSKHSDDDEPGWVMGTISKAVQHYMDCIQPKHIKLDELTQPGWGDTANYLRV